MRIKITLLLLIFLLSLKPLLAEDYRDIILRDQTLEGENSFSGTITIEGRVTVSDSATLNIKEGTKIIFKFIDTDNDNIGESEILSQGRIIVSGSAEKPVIFCSDRKEKGSWLGFSIMSVDNQSVFNYAVFEDAYMSLHSHFSNLKITNSIFRNNLRGFQSQEGDIHISNSSFYNNNTAVQFRNSKAYVSNLTIKDNLGGINFLYSQVELKNIQIINNTLFGLKIRLSKADLYDVKVINSIQNIYGRSSEIYGERVTSMAASLRGISFEGSKIILKDGFIYNNMLDGISLDSSEMVINNINLKNNGRFDAYLKNKAVLKGLDNREFLKIHVEN